MLKVFKAHFDSIKNGFLVAEKCEFSTQKTDLMCVFYIVHATQIIQRDN